MRLLYLFALFAISFTALHQSVSAQNHPRLKRLDGSTITAVEIEAHIARLMQAAKVTGLGVAILNDNKIAYGIGWGVFQSPYGKAYFKEGHDDGWENHCVLLGDKKIGLVLMANSSNGDSIFKELLDVILKDTSTPWKWEG